VNTVSNASVNFVSRSGDEMAELPRAPAKIGKQVPGALGRPRRRGVFGDAEDVYGAGADLHHEEDVDPFEGDGAVNVEKVGGQQSRGLAAQERAPCQVVGALPRGRDAVGTQNPADRGGADSAAQPAQLALDAGGAPTRGIARQAQDQFGELFGDRWPPRRSGLAPLSRDHPAVPGEQGRRSDDPVRAQGSGQAPGQRGNDRAVGPVEPRFRVAPAKYGDLVPEHQQFGVLRRRGPGEQRQPPDDADEDQIHQPKAHDKQSCGRGALNGNAACQRPRASYGTQQAAMTSILPVLATYRRRRVPGAARLERRIRETDV
jgi:hypothetical protein